MCESGGHRRASIPGKNASLISSRLKSQMHWCLHQLSGSMKNILHAHNHEAEDKNDPSCTALTHTQGRMPLSVRII